MYKFILLVCFVGVIVAYDFSDSEYNELLMHDLIDFAGDHDELFVPSRIRRHTPEENVTAEDDKKCKSKKNHGFSKCCNDNADSYASYEKFKELKKKCYAKIRGGKSEDSAIDLFSCDKIEKTKEDFVCVMECVGKETKIMDDDGNFIEDALREHVKNDLVKADWQKGVADGIIDKCLVEAKSTKAKRETQPSTNDDGKKKCNGAGLKFGHCVWREFTKSCPKELQSDSQKCTKLREKIEKGEKIDFHQFHRFHHSKSEFDE